MRPLQVSAVQQARYPAVTVASVTGVTLPYAGEVHTAEPRARSILPRRPQFTWAWARLEHTRVAGKGADWSTEWASCPAGYQSLMAGALW